MNDNTRTDYSIDLLRTCEAIHSGVFGGTGDPLGDDELLRHCEALQLRLDQWQPWRAASRDADYDEAVRALCEASLAEGRRDLERRAKGVEQ